MKTKLMNKYLAFFAAMAMLAILQSTAHGQDLKMDEEEASKVPGEFAEIYGPKIAGVWKSQVNITNCISGDILFSFEAMGLFGADGTFLDTNVQNPATRSSAFGYWDHVRGNQYRFVSRWFRFAPDGTYLGSNIVRHTIVLALDGESYESAGTGTFYDQVGNEIMVACSTASSVRFR